MSDKNNKIKIGSLEIDFGNEKYPKLRKTMIIMQIISIAVFLVVAILSMPLSIPAGIVTTIGAAVTVFNIAALFIPLLWEEENAEEEE